MKKVLLLTLGLLILFTSVLVNCAAAEPIDNYENGHYYDVITVQDGIVWNDAKNAAEQLTLDVNGIHMKGHLATIDSWDENEFIMTNFPMNSYWIGGFQQAGSQDPFIGWQWVTGEPWDYTNWNQDWPYDIDDNEYALLFSGWNGQWYGLSSNSLIDGGYIVEYEEMLEKPSILGQSVTPNFVSPQDETTFAFKINNPNDKNVDVRLVAQIRANDSQGEWIEDPANDQTVTLIPGENEKSRIFTIPEYVSTGSYDARWVIKDADGNIIDSKIMPSILEVKIHITGQSLSPGSISPGETVTFNFDISNPNTEDTLVKFVTKIRKNDTQGEWTYYPNFEIVAIPPGSSQYSRTFYVPKSASLGYYDAQWMITNEIGVPIDSKIMTNILEVSGLYIKDQNISPIFIESGNKTLTFNYTINNPAVESISVRLGARIRSHDPLGDWIIDDQTNDPIVILDPGINYCSRTFTVPQSAVPGFYDAEWSIFDETARQQLYVQWINSILKIGKSSLSDGPDYFGYTFKDSNVEGGPTYNWIDITSNGTKLLHNSEIEYEYIKDIPIGFSFNFYGVNYTHIGTTNNGIISVGSGDIGWGNQGIGESGPHNLILPIWNYPATWDKADAVYCKTIGDAPNRKFIVLWNNIQHYDNSPNGVTFEAILFEGSNNILFQYKDVDFGFEELNLGGSATVGIEGPDGRGLEYSYGEHVIEPEKAILFKFPQYEGPNLYLSKHAPDSKDSGSSMTYTLYYNNFGNSSAKNVVLEDRLPDEVEFESASDGGVYDSSTRTVSWDIGSVDSGGHGYRTLNVNIPRNVPVGTVITNNAIISTLSPEERYDDNGAQAETRVTELNLPPNVGVEPNNGGIGTPSVYWGKPVTFSYYSCPSATAIDINIHIDDGGPDIIGNMAGGPPDWTYTTTFYPRHGSATVTYTVHGCNGVQDVSFNIYIDPAGYIYDVDTGQRIAGASVWLQRPDGEGGWENVPTGESTPVAQPDVNPQVTNADGMYQWDVLEGSYRVHVEADGYTPADSLIVSVPPPVTDLHVGLHHINVAPVADAGGPYKGTTNVSLLLNGSRSYDPDESRGDSIVSYEWDLDGDGNYNDATGETVDRTWGQSYSGKIGLRVTDRNGETNTNETTINIVDRDRVPPIIQSVNLLPANIITGSTIDVTVNVTDNIGVSSVNVNSIPLLNQDENIWKGSIIALEGTHFVNVSAVDGEGNIAWNNNTAYTAITPDNTPPFSIINLQSTNGITWLNWIWENPSDPDFNHIEIYLNGIFQTNTTIEYFNATDLQPETSYTLSTRTADVNGNVNETWVNSTATTGKKVTPILPVFPDYTNPPTDPNHDGLYEDINGNGILDFDDVVVYYDNMDWIGQNAQIALFDYNKNGFIEFDDVVKLCDML